MELLNKLLDLIIQLLNSFKQKQEEKKEIKQTEIKQQIKTEKKLAEMKEKVIQKPKKDDFFSDEDGW